MVFNDAEMAGNIEEGDKGMKREEKEGIVYI